MEPRRLRRAWTRNAARARRLQFVMILPDMMENPSSDTNRGPVTVVHAEWTKHRRTENPRDCVHGSDGRKTRAIASMAAILAHDPDHFGCGAGAADRGAAGAPVHP